jgi:hypothetical protein
MPSKQNLYGIAAVALLAASLLAPAHGQNATITPSNVPGIGIVAPPPADFDPINATRAQRAQYHVPPAPDPKTAPRAYAEWVRAMAGLRHRENPTLEQTDVFHGPVQRTGGVRPLTANSVSTESLNWSGTVLLNPGFPQEVTVVGEFVVPTAHQPFGTCSGGWTYAAEWPGIDGDKSNDVLQAGTEADAYCNGSTNKTRYYAWTEWYPAASVRVSSPKINPGDLVYIQVWSSSPTTGFAFIYDVSTDVSAEYNLTPPAGTTLQGNSVEWIVERPSVGGKLASLSNYIDVPWSAGSAQDGITLATVNMGQDPSVGTLEVLTMVDNSFQAISTPVIENDNFLWFQNSGSSCGNPTQGLGLC